MLLRENICFTNFTFTVIFVIFFTDTTFMYVIAILCMLKIYQTRHPDIVATAQASFGILAFVVIAGVISVYESSIYFWVIYTILHLMGCLALSASIYYMGRWKLGKLC